MALSGVGFRPEYFDELAELEARNFWFRGRNNLVIDTIRRFFPAPRNFLEVGCGTGFVLSGIARAFPRTQLSGSELFLEGLVHAAQRLPEAHLMQMDARRIPYTAEFDLVGAFDVIEHIEDDDIVLLAINEALVPGGGVVLTVPQHPWLWSHSDDYACHVRRYRRGELEEKLARADFNVVYSTSFVTLLFPLLALSRLSSRQAAGPNHDPSAELKLGRITNAILYAVVQVERQLIRLGVRFPFGGTRLVFAVKNP
ncbi:MAG: class I SAM-dependent methyltransferase [Luteimonas sp.]